MVDLRFSSYIQITPHCPHAAQSIGSKMFSHKEINSDFFAVRHQLCGVESALRKAFKVMFNIPQCFIQAPLSRDSLRKTSPQRHPTKFTQYYRNDTLKAVSCCVALLVLCGLFACRVGGVVLCCDVVLSYVALWVQE